jgi:SAM-dependent methyltransferase
VSANLVEAAIGQPYRVLSIVLGDTLHPGGEAASRELLDRANVDAGKRVLDAGCGAGHAVALARDRGAKAWGLDTEADSADVRGRLEWLPIADASVDVVLSECAMCLADDLDEALTEAARVIQPGGRLAISDVTLTRNLPEVPDRLARPLCLTGRRSPEHLRDRIQAAGFAIEDTASHREALETMRDEIHQRVDVDGLLAALGERGQRLQAAVDAIEGALDAGDLGYVSIVARRPRS